MLTVDSCQYEYKVKSNEAYLIKCDKNGASFEVPKEVKTPDNKTLPIISIWPRAFNSVSFQSITFAEGSLVKILDNSAFADSKITSISIPSSLVSINSNAFKNCIFLESVIFPDSSKLVIIDSYAFHNTKIRNIIFPNSLKEISSYAFSKTLLKNIELPKSIKDIGVSCFSDCFFLETVKFSLDSSVSIYNQAFSRSTVKEVHLPKTINRLGAELFFECQNMPKLFTPEGCKILAFERHDSDQLTYLGYNIFKSCEIGGFSDCHYLENFVIPSNNEINQIKSSAFERSTIQSINISESITTIGEKAFNECKKLINVTFHERSCLRNIYDRAFRKTSIKRIDFPASLEKICSSAFEDCTQLMVVNFPEQSKCSFIHNSAFRKTSIEEFHVPPLVRSIECYAFFECHNLKLIVFPEDSQCEFIKDYSFFGTDISEIKLPQSLKNISQFSFTSCRNLTKLIFHPSGKLDVLDRFAICNSPVREILAGEQNRDIIMNVLELNPDITVTMTNLDTYNSIDINKNIGNRVSSRVISLQQENNDLKQRIISLNSDVMSLSGLDFQVSSLESENNDLKKRIMEAHSTIRELEHEINLLKINMHREQETEGQKQVLLSGQILDQANFEIISQLGRGRKGDVFLVKNKNTGQLLAKKVYGKNDIQEENKMKFTRECYISCSIMNPCICRFVGFCLPSSQSPASIFFEYMEGGTLQEIIDSNPHEWTSTRKAICVIEIVIGMKHLHEQGIIHRDLKPSNILCTKRLNFKISDFSESIFGDLGITMTGGVGTVLFMSPEILNEDPYDLKTDVFSFGSILFNIVTGAAPKAKLSDIMKGKRAQIPEGVSPLAKEIIDKCWLHDPSARPSFSEIFDILEQNDFMIFDDVDSSIVCDKLDSFIVK